MCTPSFCKGAFIAKQSLCMKCCAKSKKKNTVIYGTLYSSVLLQFETNAKSANVTWVSLKLWNDIGHFFYHGGILIYPQITDPRACKK